MTEIFTPNASVGIDKFDSPLFRCVLDKKRLYLFENTLLYMHACYSL